MKTRYALDKNTDFEIRIAVGWYTSGKRALLAEDDEAVIGCIKETCQRLGVNAQNIAVSQDRVSMIASITPAITVTEVVAAIKKAIAAKVTTSHSLWTRAFWVRSMTTASDAKTAFAEFGARQEAWFSRDESSAVAGLLRKYSKEELAAMLGLQ